MSFTQFKKNQNHRGRPLSTPSVRLDAKNNQLHFSVAAQREIPAGFLFSLQFNEDTGQIYLEKVEQETPDVFKMPKGGTLTVTGFAEDSGFKNQRWSLTDDNGLGYLGEPIPEAPKKATKGKK